MNTMEKEYVVSYKDKEGNVSEFRTMAIHAHEAIQKAVAELKIKFDQVIHSKTVHEIEGLAADAVTMALHLVEKNAEAFLIELFKSLVAGEHPNFRETLGRYTDATGDEVIESAQNALDHISENL